MSNQSENNQVPPPSLNASTAIQRLKEGNQRFTSGIRSVDTMLSSSKLPLLAQTGQRPFAIVLTCSDSRVPVEMIFDQGVGDLFVIRIAGNVLCTSQLASIELAATQFSCPLLLVLGHTQCSAIKACLDQELNLPTSLNTHTPSLDELFSYMQIPIKEIVHKCPSGSPEELWDQGVMANVKYVIEQVTTRSPTLKKLVENGNFALHGAVFQISDGTVDFFK